MGTCSQRKQLSPTESKRMLHGILEADALVVICRPLVACTYMEPDAETSIRFQLVGIVRPADCSSKLARFDDAMQQPS